MELRQILPRDPLNRLLGAGAGKRVAVRMSLTVQQSGEHSERYADGLDLLLLDLSQALALEPLEVGLGERRVQDHVGEDVE